VKWRVGQIYPVVPGKLYFTSHSTKAHTRKAIEGRPELSFSSTLEPESYHGYCKDFGPRDLASVVPLFRSIWILLHDPRLEGRSVVYYTEADSETLSNAAFLLGTGDLPYSRGVPGSRRGHITRGRGGALCENPADSVQGVPHSAPPLPCSKGYLLAGFDLSILECLNGLAQGDFIARHF